MAPVLAQLTHQVAPVLAQLTHQVAPVLAQLPHLVAPVLGLLLLLQRVAPILAHFVPHFGAIPFLLHYSVLTLFPQRLVILVLSLPKCAIRLSPPQLPTWTIRSARFCSLQHLLSLLQRYPVAAVVDAH